MPLIKDFNANRMLKLPPSIKTHKINRWFIPLILIREVLFKQVAQITVYSSILTGLLLFDTQLMGVFFYLTF